MFLPFSSKQSLNPGWVNLKGRAQCHRFKYLYLEIVMPCLRPDLSAFVWKHACFQHILRAQKSTKRMLILLQKPFLRAVGYFEGIYVICIF